MNLLVPKICVQKLAAQAQAEARSNFWAFRRYMRPDMLWGWWVERVAVELQQFYLDLVAGKRPQLAIMAPPQHGKSWAATDFIAWVAGKNPNLKTIFASYSDDLGMRTNLDLQRMFMSPAYRSTFPNTRMGVYGWQCNTSLIEFAGHSGSFRNTTTGGSINGMELHLGVIDDPIRGRADAQSKGNRDKVWAWFTDDWGARFANEAGMLIIVTRWHVDDLVGRLIEKAGDDLKVLAYPAIAERDEEHRKKGEALFPELKPLDFLLARKKVMSKGSWESEYQQKPYLVGGGCHTDREDADPGLLRQAEHSAFGTVYRQSRDRDWRWGMDGGRPDAPDAGQDLRHQSHRAWPVGRARARAEDQDLGRGRLASVQELTRSASSRSLAAAARRARRPPFARWLASGCSLNA